MLPGNAKPDWLTTESLTSIRTYFKEDFNVFRRAKKQFGELIREGYDISPSNWLFAQPQKRRLILIIIYLGGQKGVGSTGPNNKKFDGNI